VEIFGDDWMEWGLPPEPAADKAPAMNGAAN
jgi:hypothetical protein